MAMSKPILTEQLSKNGHVPPQYIRPLSHRPTLLHVDPSEPSIPLIDFEGLNGSARPRIIKAIGLACQTDGFFQVKNHGIPNSVIEDMACVSREFFKMSESERLKSYSDDTTKSTRLSTSFNVKKEKVSNWRDYLRLHCYPLISILFIVLISTRPYLSTARPLGRESGLKKEILKFQSLQQGDVPPPCRSDGTYTPGAGGHCPKQEEMNSAAHVPTTVLAPAFEEAYSHEAYSHDKIQS